MRSKVDAHALTDPMKEVMYVRSSTVVSLYTHPHHILVNLENLTFYGTNKVL